MSYRRTYPVVATNCANGLLFVFSAVEQEKVKYIIKPAMPIALRTGGHLLVGVVKIYSKKAQYLFDDATDALAKIKVRCFSVLFDIPYRIMRQVVPSGQHTRYTQHYFKKHPCIVSTLTTG